ncbi:MAG: M3 family metallopeptidase [Deltaproteobacteria bacterium]|nr:M3 family metallopeptidase [Deltaproteobacteria bacterium]
MTTPANPLLQPWPEPHGLPPFAAIAPEHYEPALRSAMAEHLAELDAIAADPAPPDFENTALALDLAGRALQRIALLFNNMVAAETSPALQAAEQAVAPLLAGHEARVLQHAGVFARLDDLHGRRRDLGLDVEQVRLVERFHLDYCLAGARLAEPQRNRAAAIAMELAGLCTTFTQNVLADESENGLWLTEGDVAGLPAGLVSAARQAAAQRGRPDGWLITLSRSLVVPFLTQSPRRDLREKAWRLWMDRGRLRTDRDNHQVANKILALRNELAALHGCATYADHALRDTMAATPAAVTALFDRVWRPAVAKALAERQALQTAAAELGEPADIEAWDWRYLAEKVRASRFAIDDAEVKPYFSLERMVQAAFACAQRLFGVSFTEVAGAELYHPDARLFEVHRGGARMGHFISDNFARPTKRGGAWMNEYRYQSVAGGRVLPLVGNHNNFNKPDAGQPALLSLDDVRTLFHEFGHGLHGLLSQSNYQRLACTRVLKDFVELPSQLFEHWAIEPAVLAEHALHAQTGEPMPAALLERVLAARKFGQGLETVEYTLSAYLDMGLHTRTDGGTLDIAAFERQLMADLGVPDGIFGRHRPAHFLHLFSGPDYAAGYYVYMWAELLEADAFEAFTEAGDPFDPVVAERLHRHVYSAGNRHAPGAAFRAFRGRDPDPGAMLRKRGLGG